MEKKYILTDETIQADGITLHRIKAVRDFGVVKEGELGGFVQSEKNLSHDDPCWVAANAKVFGHAKVEGMAMVGGDAKVYGNAIVSGLAFVCGRAEVCGQAKIEGMAMVGGDAKIFGDAEIFDQIILTNE